MLNSDEALVKRAYHEAGRAWALYKLCSALKRGDNPQAPSDEIDLLMRYCKKFAGLSVDQELTNWRDVAEFWRATHSIFLGGYAAERIKWNLTEPPSLSEPEFEKSYYATQWFEVDLDRNPEPEEILSETLAGLERAIQSAQNYWDVIDALAQTLLEKRELSARETFEWITGRVDQGGLAHKRSHKPSPKISDETPVPAHPHIEEIPDLIQAADLDVWLFNCCLQAELYPFKCPDCGHIMVYCRECDTLFPELRDTNLALLHVGFSEPLRCPGCNYLFERDLQQFLNNPAYLVRPTEWADAGHASLLTETARLKKLEPPG